LLLIQVEQRIISLLALEQQELLELQRPSLPWRPSPFWW
jgi:hypothetical protein